MNDPKNTYLFELPEEGKEMLSSGEAEFGSGGLRHSGSQAKQVKPSPLTLEDIFSALDLKINNDKEKVHQQVEEALEIVEGDKSAQLNKLGSQVTSALRENYTLTRQGFEIAFAKLDSISDQIQHMDAEQRSHHYKDLWSRAQEYIEWLESAIQDRIPLPAFDSINSDVLTELSTISTFIRNLAQEADDKIESYGLCSYIIMQLLEPFMKAVLLFSQRYYFDNRRLPRSITKWLETIKLVSTVRLNSGYEYYLRLYTDMRYVDKVAEVVRARNSCRNLSECVNLLSSAIEDPALVANDPRLADYIKNGCEPELPDQPSSIQLN